MLFPNFRARAHRFFDISNWSQTMKIGSLLTTVAIAAVACSAQAVNLPGPVVSADWLQKNLKGVTVLDVRYDLDTFKSQPEYSKTKEGQKYLSATGGHIPGALAVDYNDLRTTRKVDGVDIPKLVLDQQGFQALMQSIGLNSGKPIVITSPGEGIGYLEAATRLYWSLKYYGETSLALLDGGNAAWLQAGYSVDSSSPGKAKGNWLAQTPNEDLRAETSEVTAGLNAKVQMIDARSPVQYSGIYYKKPKVKAGGHIAGAKMLPPDVRSRSIGLAAEFLSADEYRNVYSSFGIDPDAPSVNYCNTGHLASGAWFIQYEILGNKQASLYDGSMTEWTTLGHPVVGLNSKPK